MQCNSFKAPEELERVREMAKDDNLPLFETKLAKGRILFQFYSLLIFVGTCFIFAYRLSHIPAKGEPGRWAWIGLFFSELWFCFYWFVTTVVRWNPIYRNTFKDRLSHRYISLFHMRLASYLRYIACKLDFLYIPLHITCFSC